MATLLLVRRWVHDNSVLGDLYGCINGVTTHLCHTLEDSWKGNKKMVSCIKAGEYPISLRDGVAEGSNFKFPHLIVASRSRKGAPWKHPVPNRDFILIHPGNKPSHVTGCILPGTSFKNNFVLNSRVAFKKVMRWFDKNKGAQNKLVVKWDHQAWQTAETRYLESQTISKGEK